MYPWYLKILKYYLQHLKFEVVSKSAPGLLNPIPRPQGSVATTVPGSTAAPTSSNGAPPMVTPPLYQPNPMASTGGGYDSLNANAQAPEANH